MDREPDRDPFRRNSCRFGFELVCFPFGRQIPFPVFLSRFQNVVSFGIAVFFIPVTGGPEMKRTFAAGLKRNFQPSGRYIQGEAGCAESVYGSTPCPARVSACVYLD